MMDFTGVVLCGASQPVTSTMRSIVPGPSTWTVIAPPVPSATTAALAIAWRLASRFNVETPDVVAPAGKARMSPCDSGAETVKLKETAWASEGMPHPLRMLNVRCAGTPGIEGGSRWPVKAVLGVSMIRQGGSATKGRGVGRTVAAPAAVSEFLIGRRPDVVAPS
jgi:hypothetical protein